MLCLPLCVFLWTQKDVLLSSLCRNGKQITVSTNLTEAPVPLSDRHSFLLASSVTVLLWWMWAWTPTCPSVCCLWAWRPLITRELSPAVPPVPPESSQHSPALHISSCRMRAKGGMCFPATKDFENLPQNCVIIQLVISQHSHDEKLIIQCLFVASSCSTELQWMSYPSTALCFNPP